MARLYRSLVATFPVSQDVEFALQDLIDSGIPMDQVSVISKDSVPVAASSQRTVTEPQAGNKAQEGATTGTIAGGAIGGTIGLIVGVGAAAVFPATGPVMLLGAAATVLATTLGGGIVGATAGVLLGLLVGYGIPEDDAKIYRDRIQSGNYVVIVEGLEDEIRRAEMILQRWKAEKVRIYDLKPPQTIPN